MDSVTDENVKKLLTEKGNKEQEQAALSASTPRSLWLDDLDTLEKAYANHIESLERSRDASKPTTKSKKTIKKGKKIVLG